MSTIGEANIKVEIDLTKLNAEMRTLMSQVADNTSKITQAFTGTKAGADNASSGVNKLTNSVQSSKKSFMDLAGSGTLAIRNLLQIELVTQAMNGLRMAVQSVGTKILSWSSNYADAELVTEKLRSGLERLGDIDTFDKLKNQVDELARITPFADDDIMNMQATLTTFGLTGDAISKLTPAMLNLSSAFARAGDTGMDLQSVAMLIGKAAGADMVGALTRVGVIMTDTQKKLLETAQGMYKVNLFLEIMKQNGNITAEAFGKTLAGQIQTTRKEISELAEELGKVFSPILQTVMTAVQNFVNAFKQLPDVVKLVIGVIALLTGALAGLIPILTIINVKTAGVLIVIGALVTALSGTVLAIGLNINAIQNFITSTSGLNAVFNSIVNILNYVVDKFKEFWSVIKDALMNAVERLSDSISNLFNSFEELSNGSTNLNDLILLLVDTAFKLMIDTLVDLIVLTTDIIVKIADWMTENEGLTKVIKLLVEVGLRLMIQTLETFRMSIDVAIVTIRSMVKAFNILYDVFSSIISAFAKPLQILGIDNVVSKIGGLISVLRTVLQMMGLIGLVPNQAGKYDANQGRISDAKGSVNEGSNVNTGNVGNSGKGGKGGNEKNPADEELKKIKEIISARREEIAEIERKIEREEASKLDKLEELEAMRLMLIELEATVQYEENKKDIATEISKLKNEELALTKQMKREFGESVNQQIAEMKRKMLEKQNERKLEQQLERERLQLKIKMSDDEYQSEVMNINMKYDLEKQRINENYRHSEERSMLLMELEIARQKELSELMTEEQKFLNEFFTGAFNDLSSFIGNTFGNMWNRIFGEANSLFEQFFSYVSRKLLELAASGIFKWIIRLLSGGGGILGFIGGLFGGGGASAATAGVPAGIGSLVSSTDFSSIPATNSAGRIMNINVNIDNVNTKISKLTGLNEQEWISATDEILPKISQALKRINKKVLDNQISN